MPRVIPLDPTLLAYERRLAVDGVELVFDVEWRARVASWYITLRQASGAAIVGPRRVATDAPLASGELDARLPPGVFIVVRIGGGDADPDVTELGTLVQLQYWTPAEIAGALA